MVRIRSFALVIFIISSTCYRLRVTTRSWVLPLETSYLSQFDQEGESTNANPPTPTPPPLPDGRALADLKRDTTVSVGSNTCGWRGNENDFLVLCNTGWTCTNSATIRQCCSGAACTTSSFATACLAATAQACAASTGHEGTMCCTRVEEAPYCATYLWSTSETPGTVFTYYGCDLMLDAGVQIIEPTPPSIASSSTSSILLTSSSSGSPIAPASSSPAVSTASSLSSHNANSQKPIGAIIGGSIGGAAVVGLFILGALFIMYRQKRLSQQGGKETAAVPGDSPGDFNVLQQNPYSGDAPTVADQTEPGHWQSPPNDSFRWSHDNYHQPMAQATRSGGHAPSNSLGSTALNSELSASPVQGRTFEMEGDLTKDDDRKRAELS